jgi:CSLREA domain-containing protein
LSVSETKVERPNRRSKIERERLMKTHRPPRTSTLGASKRERLATPGVDWADQQPSLATTAGGAGRGEGSIPRLRALRRSLLGVLLLGALATLHADTLTVANLNDSGPGSLRQAIADAAPGDTIDFAVTGTITLTSGELVITNDLTIVGPGATNLAVSGNNSSQIFRFANVSASLSGLTVSNGRGLSTASVHWGGGIVVSGGYLSMVNVIVLGNHAHNAGGIFNDGTLAATNCTFSGNSSENGAAIRNDGTAKLIGCTFSGNADSYGGALAQPSWAGPCEIVSCTFASNIGRGIRVFGANNLSIKNCIVADNSGTLDAPDLVTNPGGVVNSLDFNLIGNTNGATITGVTTHNIYGVDPLLGPLADNGGPTLTHALLPGSTAIDHGSSGGLATDQRGLPRPFNFPAYFDAADASDIGAVEMQEAPQPGPVFTVNSTNDVDDGVPGLAHCSLREAIAAANANADTNTINFATAIPGVMTGLTGTITLTNVVPPNYGRLEISNSVAIIGPGAEALSINGNDAYRVFQIQSGNVAISGLKITHGKLPSAHGPSESWVSGAGINNFGDLRLSDCIISENTNNYYGGGAYNGASGIMEIARCIISTNMAANGGGIWNNGGNLSVDESTFIANTASSGGALNNTGSLNARNTTISGNLATFNGGGLFNSAGGYGIGNAVFQSCSIVSNITTGTTGGGVWNGEGPRVALQNCIVSGNAAAGGSPDCKGVMDSLDFNLIGDTNGCTITNLTAHNIYNQDPKLGPLADLGGPTPTHALRFDSPALDAGHLSAEQAGSGGLTTDQRGLPRPIDDPNTPNANGGDGSDIGAYEADPALRLTGIGMTGPDLWLNFSTLYGRTYAIEWAPNVTGPWDVLTNNVPGTGSPLQALDDGGATQPRRFYRGVQE